MPVINAFFILSQIVIFTTNLHNSIQTSHICVSKYANAPYTRTHSVSLPRIFCPTGVPLPPAPRCLTARRSLHTYPGCHYIHPHSANQKIFCRCGKFLLTLQRIFDNRSNISSMRQSKHISFTSSTDFARYHSIHAANRRLKRYVKNSGCQRQQAQGIMCGRVHAANHMV